MLAVVKEEGGKSGTICRSGLRQQQVYQSLSYKVEIRLMIREDVSAEQPQYLLRYEGVAGGIETLSRTLCGSSLEGRNMFYGLRIT